MRTLFILLTGLLLSGCSNLDAPRQAAMIKGAEAADRALIYAEWELCYAATVGSIKRRYGRTLERANTYQDLCDGSDAANPIAPK